MKLAGVMCNRFAPAAFVVIFLAGCSTPVTTVQQHAPDLSRTEYDQFVARRIPELQRMGGPFSDPNVAAAKAEEEAKSRYGDVPAQYSTTTTWGSAARAAKEQARVKDTLEKMDRDETKR